MIQVNHLLVRVARAPGARFTSLGERPTHAPMRLHPRPSRRVPEDCWYEDAFQFFNSLVVETWQDCRGEHELSVDRSRDLASASIEQPSDYRDQPPNRTDLGKSRMKRLSESRCYLCGRPVRKYSVDPGETPPPDHLTRDHVPPAGLFPDPKPSNLLTVPCCYQCNNRKSSFEERLRILATIPFDRNQAGAKIAAEKVFAGTLARGSQIDFIGEMLRSMRPIPGHPELQRITVDATEWKLGMIRIVKGLLAALFPEYEVDGSVFGAMDLRPVATEEQLRAMAVLKNAKHLERGSGVFHAWYHVEPEPLAGCWMLAFYECLGFLVYHTKEPGSHPLWRDAVR